MKKLSAAPLRSSQPLPPVLFGDFSNLSREGKTEAMKLSGPHSASFIRDTFVNWTWIAGAALAAILSQNPWVYAVAVVIISWRQLSLALLMHDQVHHSGFRGKRGDLFTNVFCAWPLALDLNTYGAIHLAHHQHFFSELDPDGYRKTGEEWAFPMPWSRLLLLFVKDLSGINAFTALKAKQDAKISVRPRSRETFIVQRIAFYISLILIMALSGQFLNFLILWILPLMTLTLVRTRFMAICEHVYNLNSPTESESTPIIEQGIIGRICFPNQNFGYHIYHHLRPSISFENLPKIHKLFLSEGLVNRELVFANQFRFVWYLQTRETFADKRWALLKRICLGKR